MANMCYECIKVPVTFEGEIIFTMNFCNDCTQQCTFVTQSDGHEYIVEDGYLDYSEQQGRPFSDIENIWKSQVLDPNTGKFRTLDWYRNLSTGTDEYADDGVEYHYLYNEGLDYVYFLRIPSDH